MSHCEAQIAHYWCGLGNNAIIVFDFGLNIYIYMQLGLNRAWKKSTTEEVPGLSYSCAKKKMHGS